MSVVYGAYDSDIERRVAAFLRTRPQYQQFGQPQDDAVWNGGSACTHTVWQTIIRIVKGAHYSLNEINTLAGMPYKAQAGGVKRGMRPSETQYLINRLNLPYETVLDKSWTFLRDRARWGPVMYAMRYGNAPEWKGYRYSGVTASRPFAIAGGKTQLVGFENGRHAVLLAACRKATVDGVAKTVVYRKDPNHGSPSRPEKPPYDIITSAQSSAEYVAYRDRLGNRLYAVVPTKPISTKFL